MTGNATLDAFVDDETDPEPATADEPAPRPGDGPFCPWCGATDLVDRRWAEGTECGDCEAVQPTDADWYPEMIFA